MAQPDSVKRKDGSDSTSPSTVKKRRVLEEKSTNIASTPPTMARAAGKIHSNQPAKSSFEEDLNRLTQEIDEVGNCKSYIPRTPLFSSTFSTPFVRC